MAQFVEERWEDVSGEEEGVRKMTEEDFGLVYASQVSCLYFAKPCYS